MRSAISWLSIAIALAACRRDRVEAVAQGDDARAPMASVVADVDAGPAVWVVVDLAQLDALGLRMSDVSTELQAAGYPIVETKPQPSKGATRLRVTAKADAIEALSRVVVATRENVPIRLAALASIEVAR